MINTPVAYDSPSLQTGFNMTKTNNPFIVTASTVKMSIVTD